METIKSLVISEPVNAVDIFNNNGMNPLLLKIKDEVKKFVPDMTDEKGRKEIASMAYKVAKTKTYIDGLGKDLIRDWKNKTDKVNEERRKAREFLEDLKDEVRKPLNIWQEKEEKRVSDLKQRVETLRSFLSMASAGDSIFFESKVKELKSIIVDESWEEFKYQAQEIKEMALERLTDQLKLKIKEEKEAKELEQLRREKLEREQREREERIAKEAEDKAKKEEQEKAKILAEKVAREARESIEKAEKLEEEAKQAKIQAERAKKEAQEAEQRRVEDARRAELRIKEQKIKAEKQAKIQAEREQRETMEKIEAASKAREADKKHRGSINSEIVSQLIKFTGINESQAREVVKSIFLGKIQNVKINY